MIILFQHFLIPRKIGREVGVIAVSPLQYEFPPSRPVPGSNGLRRRGQRVEIKLEWSSMNLRWLYSFVVLMCARTPSFGFICFIFMLVLYLTLLHVLWTLYFCFGLLCSTLLSWQETRESVLMNVFKSFRAALWQLSLSQGEHRWQFPCFYFYFSGTTNDKKRRMLDCDVSAVWKINQNIFLFFHCGSHWKQNNQLLFWVCFSLKSVVKSVRISLFNLTVVWHLVNCPNRWINNLRLRIFYRPTL